MGIGQIGIGDKLALWGEWALGEMVTAKIGCPFAPNIHFPQVPVFAKSPFTSVPICPCAHLPQSPICSGAYLPLFRFAPSAHSLRNPVCSSAHFFQMPICYMCPFTPNFPYPLNAHLPRCPFAIVPIISPYLHLS